MRGLDPEGWEDARSLPPVLASFSIAVIASSPLRRCLESVQPLAATRDLEVRRYAALAPDAPWVRRSLS
jgi:broad specificity phosphatase PhoE